MRICITCGKVMDEVFGAENFVAVIDVQKNANLIWI